MELRHAINGWPEQPEFNGDYFVHYGTQKRYEAALAKAKAESILVEQSDNTPITMFKGVLEPDEFIDFEGEVEVIDQYKLLDGSWRDKPHNLMLGGGWERRQVARLNPVQSNPVVIPDQSDYATEEEFFEACRRQRRKVIPMNEEETMTDAEMHEALDALKDPKDARIKELEQDNAEGFEKYQELLIQNRNLKERVKELEAWKESDMKVWGPVIDFAQGNNLPGLKLGGSISEYVLQLLKDKIK